MTKKLDLVGNRYNYLTVIREAGRDKKANVLWECTCECGETTRQHGYDLRSGKVLSCGCYSRTAGHRTTHGKSKTPTYNVWSAMVQRCTNPNDASYSRYGARGVTLDPRWLSFESFIADMGEKPEGLTIDRTDNDGPYTLGNCRWVAVDVQNRNKRSTVRVMLNGESTVFADALRAIGASTGNVHYYMKQHGLTRQEAVDLWQQKKA